MSLLIGIGIFGLIGAGLISLLARSMFVAMICFGLAVVLMIMFFTGGGL